MDADREHHLAFGRDATQSASSRTSRPAAGGGTSMWDDIQNWALIWLPIIFMGLIAVARGLDDQLHAADEAAGDQAVLVELGAVGGRGGRRGGEGRAARGRGVHARPEALPQARRAGAAGASCCTARPAPARRCSPRRWRTSRTRRFFAQSASSFVEMFVGLGAARIRRLFRQARKAAPGDHLHRRARRRGRHARQGHLRREGPDAQPAAGRARRLRRRATRSS